MEYILQNRIVLKRSGPGLVPYLYCKVGSASKRPGKTLWLQRAPVLEVTMKKTAIIAIGLTALAISACAPGYYDDSDSYGY
jgi:hypothetical protein